MINKTKILFIALLGLTFAVTPVSAHTDPGGCFSTGVGLSITVYRADGTTPVANSGGTVQSGETVKYEATLSHLGGSSCNFEDGTLTITTPDGLAHVVASPATPVVPLISAGSPFVAPQQSYVVSESNVGGDGDLDVAADYVGGIAHTGDTHANATAGVDNSTPFQDTALTVTKTATPALETTYTWTIDKSVTPATWDLFDGDSGTSEYTIALDKSVGTSAHSVTGTITIHNPSTFADATVTDVADAISGAGAATVVCPGDAPYTINPGGDLVCTYSATLPDGTTRTNTATVTTSGDVNGGSGEAAVDFTGVTPTEANGTVNVDDTHNAGDNGPVSDDATYSYTRTFTCDADEGVNENTATIIETDQEDSASVTVRCYDLTVTKDAETTFDREYDWQVAKTADATEITLAADQSYDINYTVTATMSGQTDTNHAVSGTITIANPHPTRTADLTGVVDEISDSIGATVNCPALIVPAAGSLACTYSSSLPDGENRTNTGTATQQNYSYSPQGVATPSGTTNYNGTADVTFGTPTNILDEEVAVTDTYAGALGSVTVAESPKVFNYTRTVSYSDQECGDHNVDNTATVTTNDTQTTATDSATVLVHINCPLGCTLTQGYWKTHSDQGPAAHPDDTWNEITPSAEDSTFFLSGQTWLQVFNTAPKGNAYYNLAHQYMAAILNTLNDASAPTEVTNAITGAETIFNAYTPAAFNALGKKHSDRATAIQLAGILGSYNEGATGPGHCTE